MNTPVNGEFYINNIPATFYLRENFAWDFKGWLSRANILGLWTAPLFPYTDLQQFGLAPADRAMHYYPDFSALYSSVTCANHPDSEAVINFTDDLAAFLGYGERLICSATFTAGSFEAALVFNDIIVPAGRPMWAIMPATADANLAGVVALIGGQPAVIGG